MKREDQPKKPGGIGRRRVVAGLTAGLGLALAGLKRITRRAQAPLKEADYYVSLDRGERGKES